MPKVKVSVPHTYSVDEVRRRVEPALDRTLKSFYATNINIAWAENSANFSFNSLAFTVAGTAAISADAVIVEFDLPFAAMMYKPTAEKALTKNIMEALQ